ncbi:Oidioi.mRNA.OKI2018_I69.chr2.g7193.t1.cds [Oikopleura dioica]|uniref:Oidioi.mRNA.OKI2018_I69.chr2.g7193.t1.cds n=1 Tax=Oikopleura dioica TaxID=34765 RepID=A0ABN7T5U6_OIKDI|nr:Oidioi.mRNA.OKI2018_I69.chr2.g7193.t1.cds [Oikopleura dioica]
MDKQMEESKRMGRELDALRLQLQEIRRERDNFSQQVENFKEENEELKELWRKEVLRRDTDASELRNDILRKNALIADLTALNERNKKQNGEGGSSRSSFSENHAVSDGAVELELAQTKVRLVEIQCKNQDLEHTIEELEKSLSDARNTWINKLQARALNSVKK